MTCRVVMSYQHAYSFNEADRQCHFWLIGSQANISLATALRDAGYFRSVTTFNQTDRDAETTIRTFLTVVEHHPDARTMTIRGLSEAETSGVIVSASFEWGVRKEDGELVLDRQ